MQTPLGLWPCVLACAAWSAPGIAQEYDVQLLVCANGPVFSGLRRGNTSVRDSWCRCTAISCEGGSSGGAWMKGGTSGVWVAACQVPRVVTR